MVESYWSVGRKTWLCQPLHGQAWEGDVWWAQIVSSHRAVNTLRLVISSFRRDADEIRAVLGYNAASSGNPLPTFRDNVSVPSSRVKMYRAIYDSWTRDLYVDPKRR
jgi:hypothetical protein